MHRCHFLLGQGWRADPWHQGAGGGSIHPHQVGQGQAAQFTGHRHAQVYGFDLEALAPIAAKVGPTKAEIAQPLDMSKLPEAARKCPGFGAGNQRVANL